MLEHRENILLFNVLNNETVFTNYFCNLLSINIFRDLFIEFIFNEKREYQYNKFDTEKVLGRYGRIDLILQLDNKEFLFEVKNKDFTCLTENQPSGYLEYLKEKNLKDTHLFFLIPKTYKHQDEIYRNWDNKSDVEKIRNQIFYWEDFLLKVKESEICNDMAIQMFYEFCEHWFNLRITEIKEDEMNLIKNPLVPSLMNKLVEITDRIGNEQGLKFDRNLLGYLYSKTYENYTVCFGIEYEIWGNKGLPLSIMILKNTDDANEFTLDIEDITLKSFRFEATSKNDEQFCYFIDMDKEIGDEEYEYEVKEKLKKIEDSFTLNVRKSINGNIIYK